MNQRDAFDFQPDDTASVYGFSEKPLNLRRSALSIFVHAACNEIGHQWRAAQILKSWDDRATNPDRVAT